MTDTSTVVSASTLVADVLPYVQTAAVAVITGASAIGVALVKKYVGIAIDKSVVDKIDAYVEQLAAAEIAKAADNMATAQLNVDSPLIRSLANDAAAALPGELKTLGLTPDAVAAKVAAAFGKLQSQMTVIPLPAIKVI